MQREHVRLWVPPPGLYEEAWLAVGMAGGMERLLKPTKRAALSRASL